MNKKERNEITATVEDLLKGVPKFLFSFFRIPKIYIVRLYAPGTEPVEPNPFQFAIVAVSNDGVAEIKALCSNVPLTYMRVGAKELAKHGVHTLVWRHNMRKQVYVISKNA